MERGKSNGFLVKWKENTILDTARPETTILWFIIFFPHLCIHIATSFIHWIITYILKYISDSHRSISPTKYFHALSFTTSYYDTTIYGKRDFSAVIKSVDLEMRVSGPDLISWVHKNGDLFIALVRMRKMWWWKESPREAILRTEWRSHQPRNAGGF